MDYFYTIIEPNATTIKKAISDVGEHVSQSEYDWIHQNLEYERFEEGPITGEGRAFATVFRYILLANKQHADDLANPFATAARLIKDSGVTTNPDEQFWGGTLCTLAPQDDEED
ncbi:hypothetical protein [uncultured Brevundimonas sp.]|uniref:hypothetical protein n=1 Tax=uncultured Brevundimonas sp. TaxID=213418 RepID=UPI0025E74930|nr:hypothetical protein [uncultured Brevundimonas sp.]